ncbi:uncharacterized protein G2W53_001433 [Senna tora]|uniref:Uncharacterized protein n=1 Tax=Senna tora TaxID=362788 RepID=A0A834XJP7_9FABA|nr:uncharacterized protein G2W53_001433 [Senna tora]
MVEKGNVMVEQEAEVMEISMKVIQSSHNPNRPYVMC